MASLGVTFQGKCRPEVCSVFADMKGRREQAGKNLHDVLLVLFWPNTSVYGFLSH